MWWGAAGGSVVWVRFGAGQAGARHPLAAARSRRAAALTRRSTAAGTSRTARMPSSRPPLAAVRRCAGAAVMSPTAAGIGRAGKQGDGREIAGCRWGKAGAQARHCSSRSGRTGGNAPLWPGAMVCAANPVRCAPRCGCAAHRVGLKVYVIHLGLDLCNGGWARGGGCGWAARPRGNGSLLRAAWCGSDSGPPPRLL